MAARTSSLSPVYFLKSWFSSTLESSGNLVKSRCLGPHLEHSSAEELCPQERLSRRGLSRLPPHQYSDTGLLLSAGDSSYSPSHLPSRCVFLGSRSLGAPKCFPMASCYWTCPPKCPGGPLMQHIRYGAHPILSGRPPSPDRLCAAPPPPSGLPQSSLHKVHPW